MSFNGSGTFVVNSAGQPVVTGTTITSTAFNLLTADLATGLSTTLTKDGQSTPTANIPMGSFKLTGLANGTAAADAVRMSQLQSNGANYITVAGTADVITGGVTPALTAYAAGNEFVFVVGSTNTTNVTLNVDGLGAKAITKDGTGALTAGDLTAGDVALVVYDGTRFQLVSASYGVSSWGGGTTGLTPASATTGAVSLAGTLVVANGGTGAATLAANNVLLGNGTSAVQVVAPGTSGNVLTSNGTTWSSTAPAVSGVTTFAGGTTGLTPAGATSGAISLAGTLAVANGGTGGTTSTGTGAVVLATNPALVGYTVNTASGVDGEWTTAGLTVYKDGVTPQHDGPLHVMSGSAGTVTADSVADEIVVENSGDAGVSILVPDASQSAFFMGTPTQKAGMKMYWDYTLGVFQLGTNKAGATMVFLPDAFSKRGEWNTTGLTCFASGVTPQHDGPLHVMSGSAGAVTAGVASDELTVESSGAGGISILTPDASNGMLAFGSASLAVGASIQWAHSANEMYVGTNHTNGTARLIFNYGNGTEGARLALGTFLVGTTTVGGQDGNGRLAAQSNATYTYAVSAYGAQATGGACWVRVDNTGASLALFRYGGGTVGSITTNGTTTAYNTTSDYRLKQDVVDLDQSLETLNRLRPVSFRWKQNLSPGCGFIAHEMGEIFPGSVRGVKDAVDESGEINPQLVDYAPITPLMVAALQVVDRRLASVEARLAAMATTVN